MPVARISLLQGKPPQFLKALSDGLHRALVETFDVPPDDRFQIIHQHAPGELVFDQNYLCGPRSDDFVLIVITCGKPRDARTKQAFYRRLADILSDAPGIRQEDLMVVIQTTAPEDWSFGNGIATMLAPMEATA